MKLPSYLVVKIMCCSW